MSHGVSGPNVLAIPAVVVDAAAAVVVEVLGPLAPGRFCVGERIGHADAVDRVLLEAVHHLRRLDAEDVVDRRHDVVDVVELRPWCLVGLDTRRPGNRHRIARPAEVRSDQLRVLERRIARPRPAGVVHVVHLRVRRARRDRRVCRAPRAAAGPCSGSGSAPTTR